MLNTHTQSEYVTFIAFLLQQWFRECSSVLCLLHNIQRNSWYNLTVTVKRSFFLDKNFSFPRFLLNILCLFFFKMPLDVHSVRIRKSTPLYTTASFDTIILCPPFLKTCFAPRTQISADFLQWQFALQLLEGEYVRHQAFMTCCMCSLSFCPVK